LIKNNFRFGVVGGLGSFEAVVCWILWIGQPQMCQWGWLKLHFFRAVGKIKIQ